VNGGLSDTLVDPNNRVDAPKSLDHSVLLQRMLTLDTGRRMPPLASKVVDSDAVALLTQWINSLPKRTVPLRAQITHPRMMTTHDQILTVRGTAMGDNLARVVFQMNQGAEQTANGATEWSMDIVLEPGVNHITVWAEDNDGKRSRPARKLLRYVDNR
jgi:hypothetical protein